MERGAVVRGESRREGLRVQTGADLVHSDGCMSRCAMAGVWGRGGTVRGLRCERRSIEQQGCAVVCDATARQTKQAQRGKVQDVY